MRRPSQPTTSVTNAAGQLSEREAAMMLSNMRLAAPEVDSALVELLSRWAMRGRAASPEPHVRNVMSTACYLHAVLAGLAVLVRMRCLQLECMCSGLC